MKRLPKSLDWTALRAEFLAGGESLNAFRLRHGLNRNWFYAKAQGWESERAKIRERAVKKSEARVGDFYAAFARETRDLLRGLLRHAKEFLALADGGRTVLPPMEIATLGRAVSEALKAAHLLEGKPTESFTIRPERGDLNRRLVDLLEAMDGERPPTEIE